MLNEYKIIRLPKLNILLAFVRLIIMVLALQLCILYIPSFVGFTKEAMNHEQENDFRIRVIANSNTAADQLAKEQLVKDLKPILRQVDTTANVNFDRMKMLKQDIVAELTKNYPQLYTQVVLGDNLFPPKRQDAMFYPQNMYHSIVVKIGHARGDNWWCSIFPSICEPEKEVEKEQETEQVTFFIWEWIKGLFD